jgi:glycosyltransferase involved in cell wall biosynthesis
MEKISIIIPVYNAEKYLDRCISSAAAQSYSEKEILLIDDGSTDQSPRICDRWAEEHKEIRVIHQKNGGVSSARNRGIRESRGDLLVMVDSDDYIAADMLSRMMKIMKETDADLVLCGLAKGKEESYAFAVPETASAEVIGPEEALHRIYENRENMLRYVVPWAKLYKKELFQGLQYPVSRIFEDIYLTHQVLYRCRRIAVTDQVLTYYYQHGGSIMNRPFHAGKLDYLDALEERILFFREKKMEDLAGAALDEYLHALIWEYSRTRDILKDRGASRNIKERFRKWYRKGYASSRYPDETVAFLGRFCRNPEAVILQWRMEGLIRKIHGRKEASGRGGQPSAGHQENMAPDHQ